MDFSAGSSITSDQRILLEGFFEGCSYPNETQEAQLTSELGLELEQLRQWFRNKRSTQREAANSRRRSRGGVKRAEDAWDKEKRRMRMLAGDATEELLMLFQASEPLWVKSDSSSPTAGCYVLVPEIYDQMFPVVNGFKGPNTRQESSKDSLVMKIGALQLVNMLLDSEKGADIFPTIVAKAKLVKEYDNFMFQDRSGTLQLVNQEMHVLSHLVPAREFFFLRHCKVLSDGVWMIADVPLNSFGGHSGQFPARRLISGCIIRQMPDDSSMVTWVEHVEINDKKLKSSLYSDLICNNVAYGAKTWLLALNRASERLTRPSLDNISREKETELTNLEGREGSFKLSERMVQTFFRGLNMLSKADLKPYLDEGNELKIFVVKSEPTIEQPQGLIAIAVGSFWLPVSPDSIFQFLDDKNRRHLWDVLSCGKPVTEIGCVSIGAAECNRISIYEAFNPNGIKTVLIFQESYKDSLGSYIVYAPMDIDNYMNVTEEDACRVKILPSGFVVSGDGRGAVDASGGSGGSLLTMAFQILISSESPNINDLKMENLELVKTAFTSGIKRIKTAFNCSD